MEKASYSENQVVNSDSKLVNILKKVTRITTSEQLLKYFELLAQAKIEQHKGRSYF